MLPTKFRSRKNPTELPTHPFLMDKENSSIFSNLVSHRFNNDERRVSMKKAPVISAVPLITSVPVTPLRTPIPESGLDQLLNKLDNYLVMTNVLVNEAEETRTSSDSLIKEIRRLRETLLSLVGTHRSGHLFAQRSECLDNFPESKRKSRESTFDVRILENCGVSVNKIKELECQNEKLKKLVIQHQQTNVKLMLRMNDSQCNGMEYFKNKLEESYQSYKHLEDKVDSYQEKFHQLQNIKEIVDQENENKTRTIECLQQKIRRNSLKTRPQQTRIEEYDLRHSRKRKSLRMSEGLRKEELKSKLQHMQADRKPPLKTLSKRPGCSNQFEEDYLRCTLEEESLQNFISE